MDFVLDEQTLLGPVGPIHLDPVGPIHLGSVGPIHLGPGPGPIWAHSRAFIWALLAHSFGPGPIWAYSCGPWARAHLGSFNISLDCEHFIFFRLGAFNLLLFEENALNAQVCWQKGVDCRL